jgi:hypothetical protein
MNEQTVSVPLWDEKLWKKPFGQWEPLRSNKDQDPQTKFKTLRGAIANHLKKRPPNRSRPLVESSLHPAHSKDSAEGEVERPMNY